MRSSKLVAYFFFLILLAAASAAQLRQIAIIELPGRPGFNEMAFAGKYLVIAHSGANTVDIFDPTRRRVIAQVPGMADPRGLAVDASNARVYVANAGSNSVAVISSQDWKVESNIPLPSTPDALLLVPQRKMLYAASRQNESISIIHLDSGNQITKIYLRGAPEDMVYDSAQDLVFVSLQGPSAIAALDAGNAVARKFKLNASQPTGLAFDGKENKLYVAARAAVLVLNPATGAEIARVPAAPGTDMLWYDQSTRSVYAVSEDGYVNMIKADDGKYFSEDEMRTEVRGHSLAFDPKRNFVYLPGGRDGRSKMVILRRVENPNSSTQQAITPAQLRTTAQMAR